MIKETFGKKIGMTQIFAEDGQLLPVTLVEIEPACILEKVSYPDKECARIGCFKVKETKVSKVKKPQRGYFEKIGVVPYKLIREVEIEAGSEFAFTAEAGKEKQAAAAEGKSNQQKQEEGQPEEKKEENSREDKDSGSKEEGGSGDKQEKKPSRYPGVEIFQEGQMVTVRAKTKGKGFSGSIKRFGLHRQPSSHGSGMHRRVGSVGASATPSKIMKNRKMPGHSGFSYRVIKNLKILKVDKENKLIFIRGSIPGSRQAVVKIKKQG